MSDDASRPAGPDLDDLGVRLALEPTERLESVFLVGRAVRPDGTWVLVQAVSPDPRPDWIENVGDGWRLVTPLGKAMGSAAADPLV